MTALTGPTVVRERVREQLDRIPGDVTTGRDGGFLVSRGTRVTAVQVIGLQPDITLVVVFAVVATDVVQPDGACRFLATRDLDLPLVHFELLDEGKALIAVHGLLGEFLSGPDLAAAIDAVSDAATTLGPEVSARFGGALLDLATPVDPTTPDWLYQPVRPAASAQLVSPAPSAGSSRPSRLWPAVGASVLGVALVVAGWVLWGAGSGLAVALVLGPLLGVLVMRRTP